jgi:hypothetical protein
MTNIPIPVDVVLGLAVWSLLSFIYALLRIAHPMKCQCGYSTMFIGRFKRHILMRHQWM